jgi:hypothetical protein
MKIAKGGDAAIGLWKCCGGVPQARRSNRKGVKLQPNVDPAAQQMRAFPAAVGEQILNGSANSPVVVCVPA